MTKVYFDQECRLCKELAGFCQKLVGGRMAFVAWQDHFDGNPIELAVEVDGELRRGPEAWEWLIQNFPILKGLDWMACQIGLSQGSTSRVVRGSAHLFKRFCSKCR
jgi:hypothetical protein